MSDGNQLEFHRHRIAVREIRKALSRARHCTVAAEGASMGWSGSVAEELAKARAFLSAAEKNLEGVFEEVWEKGGES